MWLVRYVIDGFTEKEKFESKEKAQKYYNKILLELGSWLYEIDIYQV